MNKKKVAMLICSLVIMGGLTGCMKPYDKPEYKTIKPNETAFLIPLIGETSSQSTFSSEELLAKTKVATKEIQIPHHWVKTGRSANSGEFRQSATLITVDRTPITVEWKAGTDRGIPAETKESIGVSANISVTAQISEQDAVKFLYHYNNGSLQTVLDGEIRNKIAGDFNEETGKYTLNDLLTRKQDIMNIVRKKVTEFYKQRGIDIINVTLNDGLVYDNKNIQESIDKAFQAEKDLQVQRSINEKNIEKARADAEAVKIQSETMAQQIKLKELENQAKAIEKWDGKLSIVGGNGIPIIDINSITSVNK